MACQTGVNLTFMSLREYKTTPIATKIGAVGGAVLSMALCAALAMPAVFACNASNSSEAYASPAQSRVKKTAKASKIVNKHRHVHKKIKVPTSSNLKSYATSDSKAVYYYVCKCGKKYEETYTHGYKWTFSLESIKNRNAGKPKGGIAFTGSSLFSNWDSLACDIKNAYGYPANKVYNMAYGGNGATRWVQDEYVDAVAALKPSVVVVSGINTLRVRYETDDRPDAYAARKTARLVKKYVVKLKKRIPGVKVLVVGGIKTPADYEDAFADDSPFTNWNRIDRYNRILKRKLSGCKNVRYMDIQRFFMSRVKNSSGALELCFYCDGKRLRNTKSLKSASQISMSKCLYGKIVNPYFKPDLRHPAALSYTKVWLPNVGKKAVNMARKAAKEGRLKQVR